MKNLILIAILFYSTHSFAQGYYDTHEYYDSYNYYPGYYSSNTRQPSYVPTIENNGPQVQIRRNAERLNQQLEYQNAIRTYELIYGDTYRSH